MMDVSRVSELLETQTRALGPVQDMHSSEDELLRLRRENAALKQQLIELERAADSDPLVPVFNRRAFIREIDRARTVRSRYDILSSLIYFDLDGFKQVNDQHGHAIGDKLLMGIGRTLLSGVRECDMVARLGGDEFGVLLFKTDSRLAKAKASVLALRIQKCLITTSDVHVSVSTSWGVAPCETEQSAEQILAAADRAMYQAKARAA